MYSIIDVTDLISYLESDDLDATDIPADARARMLAYRAEYGV